MTNRFKMLLHAVDMCTRITYESRQCFNVLYRLNQHARVGVDVVG